MIQRKQTLFLFLLFVTGIGLLFVPSNTVTLNKTLTGIALLPYHSVEFDSTAWHFLAIALNFIAIVLAFITVFLYKKRSLQIKFCYVLMLLELSITLVTSFSPLVVKSELILVESTGFGSLIGIIGMMSAYLAARLIKKDIELLKSADRIR